MGQGTNCYFRLQLEGIAMPVTQTEVAAFVRLTGAGEHKLGRPESSEQSRAKSERCRASLKGETTSNSCTPPSPLSPANITQSKQNPARASDKLHAVTFPPASHHRERSNIGYEEDQGLLQQPAATTERNSGVLLLPTHVVTTRNASHRQRQSNRTTIIRSSHRNRNKCASHSAFTFTGHTHPTINCPKQSNDRPYPRP